MTRMRVDEHEIRDADVFQILLDSFPDMIHSIDDQGRIVYANRAAERLLGYTHEELLGMNVREIYAEDVLDEMLDGFRDLKQRGQKGVESALRAKAGKRIPVEIRSFGIYDDGGTFLRTFSILRDLREIKELQSSLIHAGRLATIGELASGIAHDINNPLTVVMLSNEMLLKELKPEGEETADTALSCAESISKAARCIQDLVSHLRKFSRGIAENFEIVDLSTTIRDALFMAQKRILDANVRVDNQFVVGQCFTEGCPNQLEQVFVNLITNACDAMAGREIRRLELAAFPCGWNNIACWRCDVTDTGEGIPEDVGTDVFRSFFTTKESGQGTGLGLSISRGIARDHKGDVEYTSTPGKGTTFSVYLVQAQPGAGRDELPPVG